MRTDIDLPEHAQRIAELRRAVTLTNAQCRRACKRDAAGLDFDAWAWAASLTETRLREFSGWLIGRGCWSPGVPTT